MLDVKPPLPGSSTKDTSKKELHSNFDINFPQLYDNPLSRINENHDFIYHENTQDSKNPFSLLEFEYPHDQQNLLNLSPSQIHSPVSDYTDSSFSFQSYSLSSKPYTPATTEFQKKYPHMPNNSQNNPGSSSTISSDKNTQNFQQLHEKPPGPSHDQHIFSQLLTQIPEKRSNNTPSDIQNNLNKPHIQESIVPSQNPGHKISNQPKLNSAFTTINKESPNQPQSQNRRKPTFPPVTASSHTVQKNVLDNLNSQNEPTHLDNSNLAPELKSQRVSGSISSKSSKMHKRSFSSIGKSSLSKIRDWIRDSHITNALNRKYDHHVLDLDQDVSQVNNQVYENPQIFSANSNQCLHQTFVESDSPNLTKPYYRNTQNEYLNQKKYREPYANFPSKNEFVSSDDLFKQNCDPSSPKFLPRMNLKENKTLNTSKSWEKNTSNVSTNSKHKKNHSLHLSIGRKQSSNPTEQNSFKDKRKSIILEKWKKLKSSIGFRRTKSSYSDFLLSSPLTEHEKSKFSVSQAYAQTDFTSTAQARSNNVTRSLALPTVLQNTNYSPIKQQPIIDSDLFGNFGKLRKSKTTTFADTSRRDSFTEDTNIYISTKYPAVSYDQVPSSNSKNLGLIPTPSSQNDRTHPNPPNLETTIENENAITNSETIYTASQPKEVPLNQNAVPSSSLQILEKVPYHDSLESKINSTTNKNSLGREHRKRSDAYSSLKTENISKQGSKQTLNSSENTDFSKSRRSVSTDDLSSICSTDHKLLNFFIYNMGPAFEKVSTSKKKIKGPSDHLPDSSSLHAHQSLILSNPTLPILNDSVVNISSVFKDEILQIVDQLPFLQEPLQNFLPQQYSVSSNSSTDNEQSFQTELEQSANSFFENESQLDSISIISSEFGINSMSQVNMPYVLGLKLQQSSRTNNTQKKDPENIIDKDNEYNYKSASEPEGLSDVNSDIGADPGSIVGFDFDSDSSLNVSDELPVKKNFAINQNFLGKKPPKTLDFVKIKIDRVPISVHECSDLVSESSKQLSSLDIESNISSGSNIRLLSQPASITRRRSSSTSNKRPNLKQSRPSHSEVSIQSMEVKSGEISEEIKDGSSPCLTTSRSYSETMSVEIQTSIEKLKFAETSSLTKRSTTESSRNQGSRVDPSDYYEPSCSDSITRQVSPVVLNKELIIEQHVFNRPYSKEIDNQTLSKICAEKIQDTDGYLDYSQKNTNSMNMNSLSQKSYDSEIRAEEISTELGLKINFPEPYNTEEIPNTHDFTTDHNFITPESLKTYDIQNSIPFNQALNNNQLSEFVTDEQAITLEKFARWGLTPPPTISQLLNHKDSTNSNFYSAKSNFYPSSEDSSFMTVQNKRTKALLLEETRVSKTVNIPPLPSSSQKKGFHYKNIKPSGSLSHFSDPQDSVLQEDNQNESFLKLSNEDFQRLHDLQTLDISSTPGSDIQMQDDEQINEFAEDHNNNTGSDRIIINAFNDPFVSTKSQKNAGKDIDRKYLNLSDPLNKIFGNSLKNPAPADFANINRETSANSSELSNSENENEVEVEVETRVNAGLTSSSNKMSSSSVNGEGVLNRYYSSNLYMLPIEGSRENSVGRSKTYPASELMKPLDKYADISTWEHGSLRGSDSGKHNRLTQNWRGLHIGMDSGAKKEVQTQAQNVPQGKTNFGYSQPLINTEKQTHTSNYQTFIRTNSNNSNKPKVRTNSRGILKKPITSSDTSSDSSKKHSFIKSLFSKTFTTKRESKDNSAMKPKLKVSIDPKTKINSDNTARSNPHKPEDEKITTNYMKSNKIYTSQSIPVKTSINNTNANPNRITVSDQKRANSNRKFNPAISKKSLSKYQRAVKVDKTVRKENVKSERPESRESRESTVAKMAVVEAMLFRASSRQN
ncbi:hypothetical protein BB560_003299 [Smittium megazygosporum]|uniref:Uncharacterized protein n=1 Tax=Smittium megazygosporum TaxID=133381 RepID=A0A2T9ZCF3_9FUNG|nr:hypothetical protein BB560_003299 [Smittium megazygosporum]